jgi:uncharacterized protein (TIGR00730 family)
MAARIQRLCVYCGSAAGHDPVYAEAARELGLAIAQRGMSLVYGGGHVGLMGIVADAALAAGAKVTGVIPTALMDSEVGHTQLTELRVVRDMHERKALMAELADGFVALPGGIGTLEELFEVMTWLQLGYHRKPVGLLNTQGFYDDLLRMLNKQRDTGFLKPAHHALLITEANTAALLDRMMGFDMPEGVSVFSRRGASTLGP